MLCADLMTRHLASVVQPFCLFASHFHELTRLSNVLPNVKNLHVLAQANNTDISLLYKVEAGIGDESFGLHVAKLARFPDSVTEVPSTLLTHLYSPQMAQQKLKQLNERGCQHLQEQDGKSVISRLLTRLKESYDPNCDDLGVLETAADVVEEYREEIHNNAWIQSTLK